MSKKGMLIIFSVIISILITIVISLSVALAAFQTTTNSGFEITYNAINVKAKVEASYKFNAEGWNTIKAGAVNDDGNTDYILFTGNEQTEDPNNENVAFKRTFEQVNLNYEKPQDVLYVRYEITNNSDTAISVAGLTSVETESNINIAYALTEPEKVENRYTSFVEMFGAESKTIDVNAKVEIYIIMSVAEQTKSIENEQISFDFSLRLAD